MKHILIVFLSLSSVIASAQTYQLTQAFPSLPPFSRALDLQHVPDGSNRLVVVEQLGLAHIFQNSPGVTSKKVFLDLSDRVSQATNELGFLGLAFHPKFSENGYIYVNYTITIGLATNPKWVSYISRFQASGANKDTVLRSTEKYLLTIYQHAQNHNGGWIAFGPDGYLYTSLGDGGGGGDPGNRAQNKDSLLGKILRIDVDNGDPYSIPPTNPFAQGGGRPEIYAYGLRNAWRCSFDPVTNKLWAGDVGQNRFEEVDTIINGGNYGWRVKEGYACFNPMSGCDSTGFQSPIAVYPHTGQGSRFVGLSVTGGYVYRGTTVPSLIGKYVFADYNGKIFIITYDGLTSAVMDSITRLANSSISSFGVDQNNELYVVKYVANGSQIFKFVAEAGSVEQIPESHLAKVYPNPTASHLHIELRTAAATIMIVDLAGKIVRQETVNDPQYTLSIADLSRGVYTITVRTETEMQVSKLVIQR